MAWRIFSISLSNWADRVEVFPEPMPWGRALNSGKSGSTRFKMADSRVAETATPANLEPWRRALVMDWDGHMIYAGIIHRDTYDRDSKTLTIEHSDLWDLWKRRVMAIQKSAGVEATPPLVFSGLDWATQAKKVIQRSTNPGTAGLNYSVPISFQNDVAGTATMKYYGYHLPYAADALDDIMNAEGGPDIDFMPKWSTGASLAWDMRVGNLVDGFWEWDVTAPNSEVFNFQHIRDGQRLANNILGAGEGTEKKMLLKSAANTASPYPALDKVVGFKSEDDAGRLQARTNGELALSGSPTTQVSFSIPADGDVPVNALTLGGTVRWKTEGDPYLADGWREYRLIEFSGDGTNTVNLQFQVKD